MGLFSSFNVGRLALSAHQTALQVTGQNIANANNEAYTRQRVIMRTTPPMDLGYAHIGTGVRVAEIQRVINEALEGRIDAATSSLGGLQAQQEILARIEAVFNELSDTDLSSALGEFFDALEALTTNPDDASTRLELLAKGDSLSESFRYLATQLNATRQSANDSVKLAVNDVNRILGEIADLNEQILVAEGGGVGIGKANDLRDQRGALLRDLSAYIEVNAVEASDGTLNILAGGEFLVFGDNAFTLTTTDRADRGALISTVEFEFNGADLKIKGGKLDGLITARDEILTEFIDDVAALAGAVVNEINKLHSEGQGLDRFSSLTSAEEVSGPLDVLNAAGLPFTPVNGSFNIDVYNENTGEKTTVNIAVDLDGIGADSTLQSLVDEINAELNAAFGGSSPVSAEATITNRLVIGSDGDNYTFAFSEDTSGLLAAMGINTFFTGHDALTIQVNQALHDNPDLIAASLTGAPGDNANVLRMANLRNERVFDNGGATFSDFYQGVVGSMAVQSASARDRAENQELLVTSLLNERERISGVNIDEETINLISHQRAYQAAARFISIIDGLLETLINAT
ncbi:MAG: flagellar hook-associated protein FlgK [Planctomycetota bacterium]|nr:MAG: flagellar hook-associated protein FlgK [Planctomycetota bacterium]